MSSSRTIRASSKAPSQVRAKDSKGKFISSKPTSAGGDPGELHMLAPGSLEVVGEESSVVNNTVIDEPSNKDYKEIKDKSDDYSTIENMNENPENTVKYKYGKFARHPGTETESSPETGEETDESEEDEDNPEVDRTLTSEQLEAILLATASLPEEKLNLINKRKDAIRDDSSESESDDSTEKPVPKDKGKGPDPNNWGNAEFSEGEIDLEGQKSAFKTYATIKEIVDIDKGNLNEGTSHLSTKIKETLLSKPDKPHKDTENRNITTQDSINESKKDKHTHKTGERKKAHSQEERNGERSASVPLSKEMEKNLKELIKNKTSDSSHKKKSLSKKKDKSERSLRPSDQLDPNSYLGKIFENPKKVAKTDKHNLKTKGGKDKGPPDEDSSDSSESESSDSSDDSSSSEDDSDTYTSSSESSSESEDEIKPEDKKKKRKLSKKSKHRSKEEKILLQPIAPEPYNGKDDPRVFHRFVTQATEYVTDGRVPKERHVSMISNFLVDKAYTFYTREVALKAKKWVLSKFFTELFNYCFPANFRATQRRKLEKCYQGNRSVKEFASELHELFVTVGVSDKKYKVHKLWNGLRLEIQSALWKDRLNPDSASYKEVLRVAEMSEIADTVVEDLYNERRNKKFRNKQLGNEKYEGRDHRNKRYDHKRQDFRNHRNDGGPQNGEQSSNRNHTFKRNNRYDFNQSRTKYQGSSNRFGGNRNNVKKNDQRSKLTDEERDRLKEAGKCFYCRESGHMARQCPERNKMTSSSSKRPPGISNNRIGLSSLKEVDELNDLVNSSERLESIDIGMIDHFDLTDSEDEVYQALVYGDEPPEWERGDAKPYYDLFEEMGWKIFLQPR